MIAEVFRELGRGRALVVHGAGTDEIAVHGATKIWELNDGEITHYEVTPEDLGLSVHPIEELKGGDGAENAQLMRNTFAGTGPQAHKDAIAANAGGMFYLHGKAESLKEGAQLALELINNGTVNEWLTLHEEADYGSK